MRRLIASTLVALAVMAGPAGAVTVKGREVTVAPVKGRSWDEARLRQRHRQIQAWCARSKHPACPWILRSL